MTETERRQIIALVKSEVIPAIGCTEPIAVALCVAKAAEVLNKRPEKITVLLSANILKNAMGVGIPGTGMIGLPIAVALGALIGKSAYQLEVLKDSTPDAVEAGKRFIEEKRINISLKDDMEEKLYIEVCCEADTDKATAIIAGGHTCFTYIMHNGDILLDKQTTSCIEEEEDVLDLTLRKVYDFAMTTSLDDIRFILDTARLNKTAAERSFEGEYGHGLGKILRGTYEHRIMGDSVFSHILSYTSGACDARMAGAMIPVMSNSGSGNQGISATLPVLVYAEENGKSEEELIRCHDSGDEQFRQWQSRDIRYPSRAGLCRRKREIGRRIDPCLDVEPFNSNLYQAEFGTLICLMRLCGCCHGFQLRYNLANGRNL